MQGTANFAFVTAMPSNRSQHVWTPNNFVLFNPFCYKMLDLKSSHFSPRDDLLWALNGQQNDFQLETRPFFVIQRV